MCFLDRCTDTVYTIIWKERKQIKIKIKTDIYIYIYNITDSVIYILVSPFFFSCSLVVMKLGTAIYIYIYI